MPYIWDVATRLCRTLCCTALGFCLIIRIIRFHDLRHSCASLLLAQGIPMKSLQEWLGHSTFATTADTYSHLDFSSKQESAKAISAAFSKQEEPKIEEQIAVVPEELLFFLMDEWGRICPTC